MIPQAPDQRWSLEFVSDVFAFGRRFGVLAVIDDFSAEYRCLVADTSISGFRVGRELDRVMAARKRPVMIVSDNVLRAELEVESSHDASIARLRLQLCLGQ